MNRRNLALLAGAALLVLLALFLVWPDSATTNEPGHAEGAQGNHEEDGPRQVHLSDEQIETAGIKVADVGDSGSAQILVPATVAANPSSRAVIDARASGVVRSLSKNLGDYVRRGETIARIESAEAASLASALNSARARVSQLSSTYDRERRLYEANVTARQDLEAAEANLAVARSELERARAAASAAGVSGNGRSLAVTSPLSGRVTEAPITLGSYVDAGDELYHVVNDAGLQIEAALSSQDAASISVGDNATLLLSGDREVPARVRSITPSLSSDSRSATAVLSLLDGVEGLRPGAPVQVRIEASGGVPNDQLMVTEDAVQTLDGQAVVFVRTDHGFRVQPVSTGERSGGRVVILSGLKPGTKIATANAFALKAELEKEGASHGH